MSLRKPLENWLTGIWYDSKRTPPLLLRLLEGLNRRRIERHGDRDKLSELAVPLIVVGNITAGGTGKTPLVITLARWLNDEGFRVGVISRGYGRQGRRQQRINPESNPLEAGDEALLIARQTGLPVIVDRDRLAAAVALAPEVDLIIADDGLQNLRLPKDISLCVVDGARGLGNGHLLPAGPLREPASRVSAYDYLIINGAGQVPGAEIFYPMRLEGDVLCGVDRPDLKQPLSSLAGQTVNAVAGIGNPGRFFDQLRDAGLQLNEYAFPDHHRYTRRDFVGLQSLPLVMTEKDAVKCRGLTPGEAWYLPVNAHLPDDLRDNLISRLESLLSADGED